jgi:hypothetical protein
MYQTRDRLLTPSPSVYVVVNVTNAPATLDVLFGDTVPTFGGWFTVRRPTRFHPDRRASAS